MRAAGEWESSCWCSECGRVSAAPGFLFLAELRDHFWHGGGFPGPRTSGVGLVPCKGPDAHHVPVGLSVFTSPWREWDGWVLGPLLTFPPRQLGATLSVLRGCSAGFARPCLAVLACGLTGMEPGLSHRRWPLASGRLPDSLVLNSC